jgi:hypothetical protein
MDLVFCCLCWGKLMILKDLVSSLLGFSLKLMDETTCFIT